MKPKKVKTPNPYTDKFRIPFADYHEVWFVIEEGIRNWLVADGYIMSEDKIFTNKIHFDLMSKIVKKRSAVQLSENIILNVSEAVLLRTILLNTGVSNALLWEIDQKCLDYLAL